MIVKYVLKTTFYNQMENAFVVESLMNVYQCVSECDDLQMDMKMHLIYVIANALFNYFLSAD